MSASIACRSVRYVRRGEDRMDIAVIGLGLIGGSFARAISSHTRHHCRGYDADPSVLAAAKACGAIEDTIAPQQLGWAELTIVCLYPQATERFIQQNAASFAKGSLVCDTCGVKQSIVEAVEPVLARQGVTFVGAHPMAGREFSGFAYSLPDLYEGASFILTPTEDTPSSAVETLTQLARQLGFAHTVCTTPQRHDEIIAYTSQLAHIVSSAYVKSPSLLRERGFSAGSFQDMTRVAKLNEGMWTDLFLRDRGPLLQELDTLIDALGQYREALACADADRLCALLKEGRERKEESLRRAQR